MFDLSGKTALVTGAGQGVGTGIAEVLKAAGATVLINDVNPDRAAGAAAEVGVQALPFDVTDLAAVTAAIDSVGPVDILVNNAGIPPSMRPAKFLDMAPEEWAPYIDVNLTGVFNCTRATLPGMLARGRGRVITISSGAGQVGLPIGVSIYGAGKGGGAAFMRHIAIEYAQQGITANTVSLGLMRRPGESDDGDDAGRAATAQMARRVPVGRLGTGADVGFACVYLASDEASWITGQTIGLNGGNNF
ncbi:MAG TPA: SDR family NAD(P)-dependent oxidoreductase [Ilumatobacteraceae bacterium]|nr:SDR family NAD(P)-dependent oxidoreductase [Ilumatobacteraceae bacterium]